MMLYVENLDKGSELELAMLLDESPTPEYGDSRSRWLEPWAAGGVLSTGVAAARSIGRVTFFLVFESDPRHFWGARTVTVLASGLLFSSKRPTRPLAFEVVARSFFNVVVGRDTREKYRIVSKVELVPDPNLALPEEDKTPHEHLGYKVHAVESNAPGAGKTSRYASPDTKGIRSGFTVVWLDQTGYSETWFVADASGFKTFEFGMHEYARRRYVGIVLNILGFVSGPIERSSTQLAESLLSGALPNMLAVENVPVREDNLPEEKQEDEEVSHANSGHVGFPSNSPNATGTPPAAVGATATANGSAQTSAALPSAPSPPVAVPAGTGPTAAGASSAAPVAPPAVGPTAQVRVPVDSASNVGFPEAVAAPASRAMSAGSAAGLNSAAPVRVPPPSAATGRGVVPQSTVPVRGTPAGATPANAGHSHAVSPAQVPPPVRTASVQHNSSGLPAGMARAPVHASPGIHPTAQAIARHQVGGGPKPAQGQTNVARPGSTSGVPGGIPSPHPMQSAGVGMQYPRHQPGTLHASRASSPPAAVQSHGVLGTIPGAVSQVPPAVARGSAPQLGGASLRGQPHPQAVNMSRPQASSPPYPSHVPSHGARSSPPQAPVASVVARPNIGQGPPSQNIRAPSTSPPQTAYAPGVVTSTAGGIGLHGAVSVPQGGSIFAEVRGSTSGGGGMAAVGVGASRQHAGMNVRAAVPVMQSPQGAPAAYPAHMRTSAAGPTNIPSHVGVHVSQPGATTNVVANRVPGGNTGGISSSIPNLGLRQNGASTSQPVLRPSVGPVTSSGYVAVPSTVSGVTTSHNLPNVPGTGYNAQRVTRTHHVSASPASAVGRSPAPGGLPVRVASHALTPAQVTASVAANAHVAPPGRANVGLSPRGQASVRTTAGAVAAGRGLVEGDAMEKVLSTARAHLEAATRAQGPTASIRQVAAPSTAQQAAPSTAQLPTTARTPATAASTSQVGAARGSLASPRPRAQAAASVRAQIAEAMRGPVTALAETLVATPLATAVAARPATRVAVLSGTRVPAPVAAPSATRVAAPVAAPAAARAAAPATSRTAVLSAAQVAAPSKAKPAASAAPSSEVGKTQVTAPIRHPVAGPNSAAGGVAKRAAIVPTASVPAGPRSLPSTPPARNVQPVAGSKSPGIGVGMIAGTKGDIQGGVSASAPVHSPLLHDVPSSGTRPAAAVQRNTVPKVVPDPGVTIPRSPTQMRERCLESLTRHVGNATSPVRSDRVASQADPSSTQRSRLPAVRTSPRRQSMGSVGASKNVDAKSADPQSRGQRLQASTPRGAPHGPSARSTSVPGVKSVPMKASGSARAKSLGDLRGETILKVQTAPASGFNTRGGDQGDASDVARSAAGGLSRRDRSRIPNPGEGETEEEASASRRPNQQTIRKRPNYPGQGRTRQNSERGPQNNLVAPRSGPQALGQDRASVDLDLMEVQPAPPRETGPKNTRKRSSDQRASSRGAVGSIARRGGKRRASQSQRRATVVVDLNNEGQEANQDSNDANGPEIIDLS